MIMSSYPPLVAEIINREMFITLDEKAPLENLIFDRHLDMGYIAVIEPKDNNKHISLLYSDLEGKQIFTFFLGYNYDGSVNPKVDYHFKKERIKNMEINNVSSLEILIENHLKRINGHTISLNSIRKIEEKACENYSKLIKALRRG